MTTKWGTIGALKSNLNKKHIFLRIREIVNASYLCCQVQLTAFFSNPPNFHLQNAPVPQAVCQGRHKHCSEWSTLYFHAHLPRMGHFCKESLPATDICNSVNTLNIPDISIGDLDFTLRRGLSKSHLNNSLSTISNRILHPTIKSVVNYSQK